VRNSVKVTVSTTVQGQFSVLTSAMVQLHDVPASLPCEGSAFMPVLSCRFRSSRAVPVSARWPAAAGFSGSLIYSAFKPGTAAAMT
jgi:hypothetical protein